MASNTEQQAFPTSHADIQSSVVRRYDVPRSASISIEVYELGTGPTIVLLPSLGRGATDMLELAEPLSSAGYRVLCPEPRGNGRSTGPLADKTLHDWAEDIAAVIEHAGQAPVVIVGHAHGNWIARTVASDRPDLVRALVLLAGSAGKVPKGVDAVPIPPEVRAQIERCGDTALPDPVRLESLRAVFFAPGNDPEPWLHGWNTELMTMQTLAQKRTPVDDFFAGGNVPILNVQAEFDVIAPQRYAGVLREYLGDRVTNLTIRGAAHALLPERPDEVVSAILSYLTALAPGESVAA
ncbi:alpha/beta fold hydrolase [Cupriavidus alkaliphilus]|uniref:alpha/beta fold hydrolase n=1 Tax=Cupriavidus alkaliphilus TaxID=942866 RepID=UPI00339D5059